MMLWQCAKLVGTTALHCCSTMPFDAGKMEEKGAKKCPKGVRYQNTPHIDRYTILWKKIANFLMDFFLNCSN